ncbi:MAG: anaerobic glycerol-3-phosphate dehydrogenase subunit C [Bacteroides sp.]|nr:anaerobic glycerol-3-phosphate dehydrogenase subunit C [Bacteroides sp.]
MNYQQANISDNNFEKCTKCTVCTVYCPVTAVNPDYPGPKQAGPDGERYRLKKPLFYNEALKYCLNCKRCEVACPSNVKIGDIIQAARIKYSAGRPSLRDTMLASTDLMGSMATLAAPLVNGVLGLKPVKKIMDATLKIDCHRTFPKYAGEKFVTWYNRHARESQLALPHKVTYFHGCYVNYNNPQLGRDLLTVMNAVGYGVMLLEKERCCGVAKIANRLVKEATRDAKINLASITTAVDTHKAPVIATSSTCTFTMRDEYPHLLHLDNARVRSSIMLATKFIYELLEKGDIKLVFKPDFRMKVAYHTPCHMEKLGWTFYSTSILRMIPGVELTLLDSRCCGIAGTYGFKKENYAYSQAIGEPLFEQIAEVNPDLVATDCETCRWQIEMSTPYRVENPVTVLAMALDVDATCKANGL